jgi:hypothetical protein
MQREILLYSFLVVCGLGASYWASLPVSSTNLQKSPLFSVDSAEIKEVILTSQENMTTLTQDNDSKKFWIVIENRMEDKQAKEIGALNLKKTSLRFLANSSVEKLLNLFNPFYAVKKIGKINDVRRKEFGFNKESKKLEMKFSGSKEGYVYQIGARSYGTKNLFILDQKTDLIYLVPRSALSYLEQAKRKLFERRLFDFDLEDVASLNVRSDKKKLSMAHTQRDEKGELFWTESVEGGAVTVPHKSFYNWINKIKKMKVIKYSNVDSQPSEEEILGSKTIFEIQFLKSAKIMGYIVVKKTEVAGKLGDKTYQYWVKSDDRPAWMMVSRARMSSAEKDIESL